MFIFTYSAAILSILFFGFAAFLYAHKWREPVGRYFTLYVFAIGVWIGSNAIADLTTTPRGQIFWGGMALIGASFFATFFMCFVESFARNAWPKRWMCAAYYIPTLGFSLFAFSKYSVVDTIFIPGQPAAMVPGIIYTIFPFFHFGSLLYGVFRLVATYRKATQARKMQILYLETGFFALIAGGAVFDAILPIMGEYRFYSLGPQFSVIMAAFSAYAVLKHQLLDFKIVIQRGFIFSIVLSFIICCYLIVVYIAGNIFKEAAHVTAIVSAGVTTAIGIFSVPYVERYFRKVTDAIFFQDRYHFAEAIHTLSGVLNEHIDLEDLVDGSSQALQRILKTSRADIVLQNGAGDDSGVTNIRIPIRLKDRQLGVLILGEKLSGNPYTTEDIKLLETFSAQAAVALEKATLFRQLRDQADLLEKRVTERTSEIRRLQEGQQQMMVDVSHSLQTPLTIVKGELEAMKRKFPASENLETFEMMIDNVSRLTYNLLNLARLETATDDLRLHAVDLSQLLYDVVEYFVVLAEHRGIKVVTNIEKGITVLGDRNRLEEMMTNVLSNAIKYMSGGIKEVAIDLRRNGGVAEIRVKDTGIGISNEDLPHIFDRFYRAKHAARSTVEGTGLGLAICKIIVEKHRGTIGAESAPGQGTTICVSLPVAKP